MESYPELSKAKVYFDRLINVTDNDTTFKDLQQSEPTVSGAIKELQSLWNKGPIMDGKGVQLFSLLEKLNPTHTMIPTIRKSARYRGLTEFMENVDSTNFVLTSWFAKHKDIIPKEYRRWVWYESFCTKIRADIVSQFMSHVSKHSPDETNAMMKQLGLVK